MSEQRVHEGAGQAGVEDAFELEPDALERPRSDRRRGSRRGSDGVAQATPDKGEEGQRRLRAAAAMRWETAGIDPQTGGYVYRTPIPGGWLVSFPPTAGGQAPVLHVPDAEHRWALTTAD